MAVFQIQYLGDSCQVILDLGLHRNIARITDAKSRRRIRLYWYVRNCQASESLIVNDNGKWNAELRVDGFAINFQNRIKERMHWLKLFGKKLPLMQWWFNSGCCTLQMEIALFLTLFGLWVRALLILPHFLPLFEHLASYLHSFTPIRYLEKNVLFDEYVLPSQRIPLRRLSAPRIILLTTKKHPLKFIHKDCLLVTQLIDLNRLVKLLMHTLLSALRRQMNKINNLLADGLSCVPKIADELNYFLKIITNLITITLFLRQICPVILKFQVPARCFLRSHLLLKLVFSYA